MTDIVEELKGFAHCCGASEAGNGAFRVVSLTGSGSEETEQNLRAVLREAAALIASQARRIEELETFYRAVAHAAGDLDQLPDSHAFEIVWASGDEDGNPAPEDPFITAGMIRRARATLKGETP